MQVNETRADQNRRPTLLLGLLDKRERWGFSPKGALFTFATAVLFVCLVVFGAHPFLAVTHRENADLLVVEGWMPDYSLREAAAEFKTGRYSKILVTGGPLAQGTPLSEYKTFAHMGASLLGSEGINSNSLVVLPSRATKRGRTAECAETVRSWVGSQDGRFKGVNIVTSGTHSRRTRLLYQKALPREYNVGVIALTPREYDPQHWWKYSAGVKAVIGDVSGYLNARIFGH